MTDKLAEAERSWAADPRNPEKMNRFFSASARSGILLPIEHRAINEMFRHDGDLYRLYIETLSGLGIGDPSKLAYQHIYRGEEFSLRLKWAKKIIEADKCGTPAEAAHRLLLDRVLWEDEDAQEVNPEWTMSIIENAVSGDPSYYAYCMANDYEIASDRIVNVLLNDKTGSPERALYYMKYNSLIDRAAIKALEEEFGEA